MTIERLMELLHYDPSTGLFTWKVKLSPVAKIGSVAGSVYFGGRRYIAVDRKRYCAHRLAWAFVHGEWPTSEIDHKNMNGDDNRIENLRLATDQQNLANRHALRNNRLGVKGVGISTLRKLKPQRYRARIRVNGALLHLEYYATPEAASEAYAVAARQHFGEFARTA